MKIYHYDSSGFKISESEAEDGTDEFSLNNNNSTSHEPLPDEIGKLNQFSNGGWLLVDNPVYLAKLSQVNEYGTKLYEKSIDGSIVPRDSLMVASDDEAAIALKNTVLSTHDSAISKIKHVCGLTDDEVKSIFG